MRVLRAAAVACVLALLGLLVWDLVNQGGPGVAVKVDKGKIVPAPALDLPKLTGSGRISLASLHGKVVVVNFWQSSCYPCKLEARDFAAASHQWAAKGVLFLGVNAQDLKGPARAFVKHYGIGYPNVRDAMGNTYVKWGVTGVPETFFIDRRGRVVGHIGHQAARADVDAEIRHALRS